MEPIFVVGCQRSGSTMLGSMLGADSRTIAIPEAQFVADLAPSDPAEHGALAQYIDLIAAHERFRIWNFPLGDARPEGEGCFADAVRWLVRRYAATEGKPDPLHWIDHQPGHVREMKVLNAHFPKLKAVHIVRDGRAVAASLLPLAWGPNSAMSAANFWAQRVAIGLASRHFLGEDAWVQVRYEDLVSDPVPELRRLCAGLGLEFNSDMAAGKGFRVPEFTRNQHSLVGGGPDASRLGGWRTSLASREIEIFEAMVGPILTYLGYDCVAGRIPRLPSAREKLAMLLKDQWRTIVNRRRFQRRVREFAG